MQKNNINQQQMLQNVRMDTQTIFHTNGDMNIYPCPWVDAQVTQGGRKRPKGRMTIEEDGTSVFHAYRHNSGSRYKHLYVTENGELKRTNSNLIVKLTLPLAVGRMAIVDALWRQMGAIVNYIKSQNDTIEWK